jgi:hypothetical protein
LTSEAKKDEARSVVRAFILAVNERNVEAARAATGPGLKMTFPGNTVMHSIDEFFTWVAGRSPKSAYLYDTVDVLEDRDALVAYASGSVVGETVSGLSFSGVRVIDKFVIRNGKVVEKEAWSDMADFMRRAAG